MLRARRNERIRVDGRHNLFGSCEQHLHQGEEVEPVATNHCVLRQKRPDLIQLDQRQERQPFKSQRPLKHALQTPTSNAEKIWYLPYSLFMYLTEKYEAIFQT